MGRPTPQLEDSLKRLGWSNLRQRRVLTRQPGEKVRRAARRENLGWKRSRQRLHVQFYATQ